MRQRFENKVVVVTGGAQGIGRRVAERAAQEGGRVVIVDRAAHGRTTASEIRKAGGNARFIQADLETWEGANTALSKAATKTRGIDVLVNNVGGTIWVKPYAHYAPEEIEAEVRRSLFPTLWCCRAALDAMIPRRRGVIVNVSSAATRGTNRIPYSASKGGVNAVTASLALEVAQHGIRVVGVAPGGVEAPPRVIPRNPATPSEQEKIWYQEIVDQAIEFSWLGRYSTLDEQAAAILFMGSDEASYITGVTLPVAGAERG